jgi:hypothetical protein
MCARWIVGIARPLIHDFDGFQGRTGKNSFALLYHGKRRKPAGGRVRPVLARVILVAAFDFLQSMHTLPNMDHHAGCWNVESAQRYNRLRRSLEGRRIMSSLPNDYWEALTLLARASSKYKEQTGQQVVIVGGAAVSFYTQGQVLSGDFDMVTDIGFEQFLIAEGFQKEAGPGRRLGGYYHPSVPRLGFEFVSGRLFDGRSDVEKLTVVPILTDGEVTFPPIEDLIADRLAQYASSKNKAVEMLEQARLMFDLASDCDEAYLRRRIIEETGDPGEIGLV